MNRFILIIVVCFANVTLSICGQTKVAGEIVKVDSSSATVREWFGLIEQQTGLTLSYNPSLINMNEKCRFERNGSITVERLLEVVLEGYDFRLIPLPDRKLLIQIDRKQYFCLTGTVREAESNEKLMGATVQVTDADGKKIYAVTDRNGIFTVEVVQGRCSYTVSYVGYKPYGNSVNVQADRFVGISLRPIPFEIKAVNVKRRRSVDELDETAPSNMVTFSSADIFSQIRILPGISSSSANIDFHVDGGGLDENLFLLDGFPVYSPGHINSGLTAFNGDALKSVSFYKGFIPSKYEGRLSSVTHAQLREGNKQRYVNTLSADMNSAGATLEGPIIKNKLSYLVSGRRSWLDFFDTLLSEEDRMNYTFHDFNMKIACDIDSTKSIDVSAYSSTDDYYMPDVNQNKRSLLRWNNQLYSLRLNTMIGSKITNNTSLAYAIHANRMNLGIIESRENDYLHGKINSMYLSTEFSYASANVYTARWGAKAVHERYQLAAFDPQFSSRHEPVNQFSLFYDNRVRINSRLYALAGANLVIYIPRNSRRYSSIQPRFSLKYSLDDNDLLYGSLSSMEQFFHHVYVSEVATPSDFIMPSIDGFKPSTAFHLETGWKHFTRKGIMELSVYYKRRKDILALRPNVFDEGYLWHKLIMAGDGESYGVNFYLNDSWERLKWQMSYTLSKSREWFNYMKERGKMPSLYDIPHILNGAVSCEVGKRSMFSVGGNLHSGKIKFVDENNQLMGVEDFRKFREPTRFRVDASYSYSKELKNAKLLLRFGLYNILGNPSEEDLLGFFSVRIHNHCVPFGIITFKF
ncbi:MAG: TonB-dependent receptor [Prevotellaceae bacterium]|nr:TonB-dependent receptor [Prevotellaceae bacterium]MDY6131408.1 TonB-dependent receptor [Prevotella sp.]